MLSENKDHDYVFKLGLHHFLKEFLEEFFPQIIQRLEINFEFPISEDANNVQTKKGGKQYVDLIYPAKELGTGEKVMLHIEAQSYSNSIFPLRMYNYNHELRKKHNAQVISIALGFLNYPVSSPSFFEEKSIIDGEIEHYFRFHQLHLKQLNWEDYKDDKTNPIITCFLGLMKDGESNKEEIRLISYINLLKMGISNKKKQVVLRFIETYLPFDNKEQEKEFVIKLNEKAKEKGLVKELEQLKTPFYNQGKEEGKIERAKSEILRSVSRAKGSLPSNDVREIIEGLNDLNTLDSISDELWGITDIDKIEEIIRKYGNC